MARPEKKARKGHMTSTVRIPRAMRWLGLWRGAFRKLCIWKGVYPADPKRKHQGGIGLTAKRIYYLRKDVRWMSHDPVKWKLHDFREWKRKLRYVQNRKAKDLAYSLRDRKPEYKLDHIVKERYPTLLDAIRDLDDCLSLCFLYARFSKAGRALPSEFISLSRRLTLEWMHYVMDTRALRKVFVSIKGYYYQAEVMGQEVTWVAPHPFNPGKARGAKLSIMGSFMELYLTMLGFVNYKLYTSQNLAYPPALANKTPDEETSEEEEDVNVQNMVLSTFNIKLKKTATEDEAKVDQFDSVEGEDGESKNSFHELVKFQNLFTGCKFFLNREVPRESLAFVIKCFGGEVSWSHTVSEGATYQEEDETITHQIVDRDDVGKRVMNRFYIQPQWIFDSVNAKQLLPMEPYFPGQILPPHLSPFVEEKPGDYVPSRQPLPISSSKSMDSGIDSIQAEDEPPSNSSTNKGKGRKKRKSAWKTATVENQAKKVKIGVATGRVTREKLSEEERQAKRLVEGMIPKKQKRLYNKILYKQKQEKREIENLRRKRKALEKAANRA